MIKGTTPTLQFKLPISTDVIKSAEIILRYVDNLKSVTIERTMEECEVGTNTISAVLTQEETLALPAPSIAEVQLRVLTNDDVALATLPIKVSIKELLKESVIE